MIANVVKAFAMINVVICFVKRVTLSYPPVKETPGNGSGRGPGGGGIIGYAALHNYPLLQ